MSSSDEPNVIIVGGGPGGFLAAIMLADIGVKSTVYERASEPDQWSTKSYTIVTGERGQAALKRGGCLESAEKAGMPRKFIYFFDAESGERKSIPKQIAGIGFSRPILVGSLEKTASANPNILVKRGAGVSKVLRDADQGIQVHFEDDTIVSGSHVIGADGKWSKVRQSFPSLDKQGEIVTCPSYGVHMMALALPEGWPADGTYVIKPKDEECKFYIIASPVPTGELSVSMVCYDETAIKYPWLAPPDDIVPENYGSGGWKDEYSSLPSTEKSDLADQLAELFEKEMPALLAAIGRDPLNTARINRRVSWLRMTAIEGKDVTYSTEDGRVALIGDSAHAVTPSMGEGCNTAMESASKLADSILLIMKEKEIERCTSEVLSAAFCDYGLSRPKDTIPIQEKSAAASHMKKK
jgi:2-polyprenyl-6-methoxyphenol hydroxylase-like FAD-dependent oxidoreductase